MSIESMLRSRIQLALAAFGVTVTPETIIIESSKDRSHGDYASTIAMQLAKQLHQAPLAIAEKIVANLNLDGIEKAEVARPGFINFFLKTETISTVVKTIIGLDQKYGTSDFGNGKRVNVEFVSANPTGALHLGHARGAAIGDSICRLYKKAGYFVTREYYVNDAGNQIDNLAKSLYARLLEAYGLTVVFPEDGYHG
ncbi:MAG: arginine--tRNA ligase, partial [Firmicutes bacterium]|nr:arginine--tRNA ligase [Bacillota bacterium]